MDICAFVNSKDISAYLKQINYRFHSLEAAWLVYTCRRLSYEEKKQAWNEIIATMPDCEVPSRYNCKGWKSLHAFLSKYIEVTDGELQEFFHDEPSVGYVYGYSYLYQGDNRWTEEYEHIYPSSKSCLEAYKAEAAYMDEDLPDGTGMLRYRLRRNNLSDPEDIMDIEFFGNGQPACVFRNTKRTKETDEILNKSFEGLWFDFPTPFQKGDIVWVPEEEYNIVWNCDGGFVLTSLSTWDPPEFMKKSGDITDMNGWGYFVNPDGTVYHECMVNYMNLEFYKGPYKLNERILPALSKFVKGEIGVDLLLCAYRRILLDYAADDIMLRSWYAPDILKEIGIGDE